MAFQNSQKLSLRLGAHLADLVQHQCAAVGRFKLATFSIGRTGEGTFFVTKQLALKQTGRQRRAVQTDKRAIASVAGVVQCGGHQFFAGSGFTSHQHRRSRWCCQSDLLDDCFDGFAAADDFCFVF